MSVEVMLISYFSWSLFTTLIYRLVDEDWVTMAFYACFGALGVALPFAFVLLLDGNMSRGDCGFFALIAFMVNLFVFVARTDDWWVGLAVRAWLALFPDSGEPGLHPGTELCDDLDHLDRDGMHPRGT